MRQSIDARNRQATHQEKSTERINHVIDVKTVPRPLLVANAREGSVEAVTKPVERQKKCGQ